MFHVRGLFAQMKRRGVWRVAAVYAGVAFVVVEAADLFVPHLGLPGWTVRVAAVVAVAGFPVPVLLARAFDLTTEGVRRTGAGPAVQPWSRGAALIVLAVFTVAAGAAGWWAYAGEVARPEIQRLAVLPLANLMEDPDQEYLVQGMHDRLISELQQAGVAVIARTSVMPYRDGGTPIRRIAAELGVDAVIEGSVFRAEDRVTIEARLVDGASEEYLWNDSFEGDLRDVEFLHRDLTRVIAGRIRHALSPGARVGGEPAPVDPQAYEAYLRGWLHTQRWTAEDLETALVYFQRAVGIDSTYAPAWLGIARAWGTRAQIGFVSPAEAQEHAEPALRRALALDPGLPETHAAVAGRAAWGTWDFDEGEAAYRRSLELNPGAPEVRLLLGHLLTILGEWDEASRQIETGLELDPLSPFARGLAGTQYYMTGRLEASIEAFEELFRDHPGFGFGKATYAGALRLAGRDAEALSIWREEYQIRGEPAVVAALDHGYEGGGYRAAYRLAADTLAARFGPGHVNPVDVAAFYMAAGDSEKVLDWLEAGVDVRDQNMPYVGVLPAFRPLHDHPRFREIARRVGVPILTGPSGG